MTEPLFIVIHDDGYGEIATLGTVVYRGLGKAQLRAGERTRAAEEYGWRDTYRVYELREVSGES